MLPIILAPVAMLAAVVLAVGWRGRRVDDHPLCRKCGFDLTGRPESTKLCSECGSDLSKKGAIVVGHRKARAGLVWGGAVVMLLALVLEGAMVWAIVSGANLNPYKPLWLLRREAMGLSDPALTEINRRLAANALSDSQISDTVDDALRFQGDRSLSWNAKWGDFVEAAKKANKITDEQWTTYATQAPDFQISFRPRVGRGEPLAYRSREGPSRVGNGYPMLIGGVVNGTISISGKIMHDNNIISRNRQLHPGNNGVEGGGSFDLTPILNQLKVGAQTVTITAEAESAKDWDHKKPPLGRRPIRMTGSFTLLPANEPSLRVVNDESLRPAIEKAIKIKSITIKDGDYYTEYSVGGPIAMAHRIEAVVPGSDAKPIELGACVFDPTDRAGGFGDYAQVTGTPPKVVDVYFRPMREYALYTTNIFEMWGGELVFRNVPITPAPTTAPSR